jgi:hypothetical protein
VEVVFVIREDTLRMRQVWPLKPSKPALNIETPSGRKLAVDLWLGAVPATTHSTALPGGIDSPKLLQTHLDNGTEFAVVAPVLPFDDRDRETVRYHREVNPGRWKSAGHVAGGEQMRRIASTAGGSSVEVVGMGAASSGRTENGARIARHRPQAA